MCYGEGISMKILSIFQFNFQIHSSMSTEHCWNILILVTNLPTQMSLKMELRWNLSIPSETSSFTKTFHILKTMWPTSSARTLFYMLDARWRRRNRNFLCHAVRHKVTTGVLSSTLVEGNICSYLISSVDTLSTIYYIPEMVVNDIQNMNFILITI